MFFKFAPSVFVTYMRNRSKPLQLLAFCAIIIDIKVNNLSLTALFLLRKRGFIMKNSRIITLTIIVLLAATLLMGCNVAAATPEVPEVVVVTPEPTPEIELLLCVFCDVLKVEAEHCEIPLEVCIVCEAYKVEEEHCEIPEGYVVLGDRLVTKRHALIITALGDVPEDRLEDAIAEMYERIEERIETAVVELQEQAHQEHNEWMMARGARKEPATGMNYPYVWLLTGTQSSAMMDENCGGRFDWFFAAHGGPWPASTGYTPFDWGGRSGIQASIWYFFPNVWLHENQELIDATTEYIWNNLPYSLSVEAEY